MNKYWAKGAVALMAVALVASCGQPADPVSEAPSKPSEALSYAYNLSEDAGGDYVPLEPVQVENWRLKHVFIAGPDLFEAWTSVNRDSNAAPVRFVFEDTETLNADGNPRTLTLVPVQFSISDDHIKIAAVSGGVGAVSFDGRLDLDALATAKRNLGHEGAVLSGQLKIGPQTYENIKMKWWMGG